jgi:hypothetical protein
VSARIGRIGRRLDGNVQFVRPVDGNRVESSRPGRNARVARACAVACAIGFGLIAPATARAADPFGTDQLVQDVNTAVAQATTAASQATGAAAAVSPESSKTLDAATKTLEAATTQAAAVASSAATQAQDETKQAATVSVPATAPRETARAPAKPHRRAAIHRPRHVAKSTALGSALRAAIVPRAAGEIPSLGTTSRTTIADRRGQTGSARTARSAPKPVQWQLPRRSPPLPPQPQPGTVLSGQGGGHGPLTPLVVGALAAVLLAALLEFLPRRLPQLAFRKPRQIALAPWHPG